LAGSCSQAPSGVSPTPSTFCGAPIWISRASRPRTQGRPLPRPRGGLARRARPASLRRTPPSLAASLRRASRIVSADCEAVLRNDAQARRTAAMLLLSHACMLTAAADGVLLAKLKRDRAELTCRESLDRPVARRR
jgi:hypothetical protein